MHEYTIQGHDRKKFYYCLTFLSGFLSQSLAIWLSQLANLTNIVNVSLIAPSGLAIFGLLFLLFDNFLWKFSLLYRCGLIRIPNLNGQYNGFMTSAKKIGEIPVKVSIYQSYSKIRIRLETQSKLSYSYSIMASFETVDPNSFRFNYEYFSTYTPEQGELQTHYGVTRLRLESTNNRFDGEQQGSYYTDRERNSYGKIFIKKCK